MLKECDDLLSLGACTRIMVVVLFVCVSVSVRALAATYLVYISKLRQYTVSCRL